MPSTRPRTSWAPSADLSQIPACRALSRSVSRRIRAITSARAISTTERVLENGALKTATPRWAAARRSIWLVPMQKAPIARRSVACARTRSVTWVLDRMPNSCTPSRAEISSSSSRAPDRASTSATSARRIVVARGCRFYSKRARSTDLWWPCRGRGEKPDRLADGGRRRPRAGRPADAEPLGARRHARGGAGRSAGVVAVGSDWDVGAWLRPRGYVEVDGQPVAVPRPEASDGRLLPAVAATTEGVHAFLHTDDDGAPIGYDPCRPIRFVVRPDGMPPSGQALLDEAMAGVSAASGLVFEYAGTTDEAPAVERTLIQPDRYGEGWAPVLIAWSDEAQMPELAGEVAGLGGSAAVPGASGQRSWLAAGRAVLDSADVLVMLARPDGHEQARAIVMHELAHVLGLDHVTDPDELMNPVSSNRTDLGPGDLQGLALVGQVACEG